MTTAETPTDASTDRIPLTEHARLRRLASKGCEIIVPVWNTGDHQQAYSLNPHRLPDGDEQHALITVTRQQRYYYGEIQNGFTHRYHLRDRVLTRSTEGELRPVSETVVGGMYSSGEDAAGSLTTALRHRVGDILVVAPDGVILEGDTGTVMSAFACGGAVVGWMDADDLLIADTRNRINRALHRGEQFNTSGTVRIGNGERVTVKIVLNPLRIKQPKHVDVAVVKDDGSLLTTNGFTELVFDVGSGCVAGRVIATDRTDAADHDPLRVTLDRMNTALATYDHGVEGLARLFVNGKPL